MLTDRGPLTRRQVVTAIGRDDLKGERLGQVIGIAELDGLVCSGPLADGQHTYALLDDRVAPDHADGSRGRDPRAGAALLHRPRPGLGSPPGPLGHADQARGPGRDRRPRRRPRRGRRQGRAALVRRRRTRTRLGVRRRLPAARLRRGLPHLPEQQLPASARPPWGTTHASFAEAGGGVVVHGRRDVGWWKRKDSARTTAVTLGLAPSLDADARSAIEAEAEALATFTGRRGRHRARLTRRVSETRQRPPLRRGDGRRALLDQVWYEPKSKSSRATAWEAVLPNS